MRRSRVVSGAFGSGLSPDGVAGDGAALLGRAAALQVGQAGEHGGDPRGGHIDRGRCGRAVHEATCPLVRRRAGVGCHG